MNIRPVDLEMWNRWGMRPLALKKKDMNELAATWSANNFRIVQSSIGPRIHRAMYYINEFR